MERFFFNHRGDNGLQLDIEGIKLHSIEGIKLHSLNEALNEAVYAARCAMMLADVPSGGCFEIEDAGRALVGRVPYSATPGIPNEAGEIAALPIVR